jgi:NADPH2:quinone reductase
MKALVIKNLDGKIELDNIPIPDKLQSNELLIKNEGSQINPADLNHITRTYKDYLNKGKKHMIPGIEGLGTVVKVADESLNDYLGKRVVYATPAGTWAEYSKIPFTASLIIDNSMISKDEWPSFVNPLTVMCMFDITRLAESKWAVQTGASSSCGKMFIKVCKLNGIGTINIVRKKEYIDELKELGADYVLIQDDSDFKAKFKELVTKHKSKVCFECVAGMFGGLVFNLMPPKTIMYLYGSLSLQPLSGISPVEMIYNEKDIRHLTLTPYLMGLGERLEGFINDTKKFYKECFGIKIAKEFNMQQIYEALEYYKQNMSKGKVILRPKF